MTDLERQLTDHLQRRAAAVMTRPDLEAVEQGIERVDYVQGRDRPPRWPLIAGLVAAAAALVVIGVVALSDGDDSSVPMADPPSTTPTTAPAPPTSAVATPSSAAVADEVITQLEDILRARVAGTGAEGYIQVLGTLRPDQVPLLYATTSGAPYERFEIEELAVPRCAPDCDREFIVRLFADGGATVVEQPISWGAATLDRIGGFWSEATATTENGVPVAVPYAFADGEVTMFADPPWEGSWRFASALTLGDQGEERVEVLADPFPVATGCERGPAATDASALAAAIASDPDLVVSEPVAVEVGGAAGFVMDVTVAAGASRCEHSDAAQVLTQNDSHQGPSHPGVNLDESSRMRLYLIDAPQGSTNQVLAIAVIATTDRFDEVVAAAESVIGSVEFRTAGD